MTNFRTTQVGSVPRLLLTRRTVERAIGVRTRLRTNAAHLVLMLAAQEDFPECMEVTGELASELVRREEDIVLLVDHGRRSRLALAEINPMYGLGFA